MKVTEYEERAQAEGVSRPFAILRSMGTGLRNQLAGILGWRFSGSRADADRESWDILHRSLRGLQSRTHYLTELLSPFSRNNNWWEILCRTARWLRIRFDPGLRDVEVEGLIFARAADLAVSTLAERELELYDQLAAEGQGFSLATAGLELSRNEARLVMAGLVRSAPPAVSEGGFLQLLSWLNEELRREGWLSSVTRGLWFLRNRMENLLSAWWDLASGSERKRPDPNLRRISVTISAIHLEDRIARSLDEFEIARL